MDGQVETEEERLNDAFLHDNLVEVCQHIVNASKIGHMHLES